MRRFLLFVVAVVLLSCAPRVNVEQEKAALMAAGIEWGKTGSDVEKFVETIAFGPGAWPGLPEETRETFVFNAPTWLDEVHDPEALEIDLSGLQRFAAPALLTMGDQSAPVFPLVVHRIAAVMPQAAVRTYTGAGHVPHLSHPEEYVRVVTEFVTGRKTGAV